MLAARDYYGRAVPISSIFGTRETRGNGAGNFRLPPVSNAQIFPVFVGPTHNLRAPHPYVFDFGRTCVSFAPGVIFKGVANMGSFVSTKDFTEL